MVTIPELASFNSNEFINAGIKGEQFRNAKQDRNTLMQAGRLASEGNVKGARDAALAGGNLAAANSFEQMLARADSKQLKQTQAMNEVLTRSAMAAQTPEQWAQLVQKLEAGGHQIDDFERDFRNRNAIIRRGMSVADQINLQFKERELAIKERNAAQSAKGPPVIETARRIFPNFDQMTPEDKMAAITTINESKASRVSVNNSSGSKEADKKVAVQALEWIGGKEADSVNKIDTLNSSIHTLRTTPGITGKGAGITSALGETAQNLFTPQMKQTRQEIESVIQGTLKETLGAQFAKVEGEMLLERAFNPFLEPEVNARRAEKVKKVLEIAVEQKGELYNYFFENGQSISGFKPTINARQAIINMRKQWQAEDRKNGIPTYKLEGETTGGKPSAGDPLGILD